MKVIIPAYEPDDRIINLVQQLHEQDVHDILIVDDGSGLRYEHLFTQLEQLDCRVLRHPINLGKGSALKTAFSYMMSRNYDGVIVCADSDGQHLPKDIIAVADKVSLEKESIVLGTRQFVGEVPSRSQFGNALTRKVYQLATGVSITDTQTGLRGYSSKLLPWLCAIEGDRFQYEMNMLIKAHEDGIEMVQVPIDTVYIEQNASSHFQPIKDSISVYLPFIRFGGASFVSFLLDFLLVLFLHSLTGQLLLSVVIARLCSSICNFTMNRLLVFRRKHSSLTSELMSYYSLVLVLLGLNYSMLYTMTELLSLSLVFSKLVTEIVLFLLSYWVQKSFVFTKKVVYSLKDRK